MATSHQVHRTILQHLLSIRFVKVRLVARFSDPILGRDDSTAAHVFIPDMHLVTDEASENYSYTFNHRHVFLQMLRRLVDARKALEAEGHELQCTQLGDLLDLWREGTNDPSGIMAEYRAILSWLYRHPRGLRSKMLAGNHDAAMLRDPSFHRRLILEDRNGAFGVALHGDWFDPIENFFADWLQAFVVYVAGRIPPEGTDDLGPMLELLRDFELSPAEMRDGIRLETAADVGPLRNVRRESSSMPRVHNVTRAWEDGAHRFMSCISQAIREAATNPDADEAWRRVRLVVIGHTHHAQITVDDTTDPAHPLVVMDCGAWIERCRDSRGVIQKNAQIGVVCGNDCRIYQVGVED